MLIALALAVLVALLWALWPASGELPALPEKTPATEQDAEPENMNENAGAQSAEGAVDGLDGLGTEGAPAGADLDDEGITGDGMQEGAFDIDPASDSQTQQSDDGSSMLAANGWIACCSVLPAIAGLRSLMPPGAPCARASNPVAPLMLDGEAPFSLTLGNAGAVDELRVNGSAVTLPTDSPGKVVRISAP